jgi:predicted enzyme related to lactoylglutathione lyase
MKVQQFTLNVTTENPQRLMEFYRDIVGLPPHPIVPESAFMAGETAFFIDGHSDVKGRAKEPARMLMNFSVENLAAEQKRLEENGVRFIRTAEREPWGGVISTFLDPDGNYCQLVEHKP